MFAGALTPEDEQLAEMFDIIRQALASSAISINVFSFEDELRWEITRRFDGELYGFELDLS